VEARRIALRGAMSCAICGGGFRLDLGCRHPLYPSVDHVIPLSRLDLSSPAGRALAVDPGYLRVTHMGCNSRRGADAPPVPQGVSREW
jgi:5-methylcytosine-specific restriction endonuclease McrA